MKNVTSVKIRKKIRLARVPTRPKESSLTENEIAKLLEESRERLVELQTMLYASHERSVLIIFQGMDTSGKDSAIKNVMSGVNPQGCRVTSFKTPSSQELDHDFLWKANTALPGRGEIGIFNRSYYEEILITHVHPELLENEHLPVKSFDKKFWKKRYEDILHFEQHLHREGYEVIKIFLHISKDEQRRRLLSRFEDSKKLWKIDVSDIRERSFWKQYQTAYEKCLGNTASKHAPWYLVSGDDKPQARLAISEIIVSRLESLKLRFPQLTRAQRAKLADMKSILK